MAPSSDPAASAPRGTGVAWWAGACGAGAAAGSAWFFTGAPLGKLIASQAGTAPVLTIPALPAFAAAGLLGLAAAGIAVSIYPARRVVALLLAAGLLAVSQCLVLALHGRLWEPLPALLALLAGGGIALLLRPARSGPAGLFKDRLSATALATLTKARDFSFLRPDQREATILTCRLLNENALRGTLPARDFLKLCGTFRSRASAVLLAHGACLDPAEPNEVRAFFGLPLTSPSPADAAVAAALALDDAMAAHFAALTPSPSPLPVCGIGLTTGTLTAGLTGAAYTVMGDAVELSRWLAAQNTTYQTRLLLDAATHRAADNIEDRPLEFINPPEGAAVEIFQLLGTTGSLTREAAERRNAFRDAIMLLRAGHAEDACRRFDDARDGLSHPDPVLEYFVSHASDQAQRDAASTSQAGHAAPLRPAAPLPLPPRRKGPGARKLPRRP